MAKKWTEEEIQFLRFAYSSKDFTTKDIVEALKRPKASIYSKARELKLEKYKECLPHNHKRCTKCKTVMPNELFPIRKNGNYDSWCKECYRIVKLKKEEKVFEEKVFEEKVFEEKVFEKKCTKCGELKNINDFYKDKTSPDGKLSYCKKCRDKQIEEYKLKKLKERGW